MMPECTLPRCESHLRNSPCSSSSNTPPSILIFRCRRHRLAILSGRTRSRALLSVLHLSKNHINSNNLITAPSTNRSDVEVQQRFRNRKLKSRSHMSSRTFRIHPIRLHWNPQYNPLQIPQCSAYNKPPKQINMPRYLTPHRITLLQLISLYTTSSPNLPATSRLPILTFISSQIVNTPSDYDDEHLSNQINLQTSDITALRPILSPWPSHTPGRSIYDKLLEGVWGEDAQGQDCLFLLFADVKKLVQPSAPSASSPDGTTTADEAEPAKLSKFSPMGQFVRRCKFCRTWVRCCRLGAAFMSKSANANNKVLTSQQASTNSSACNSQTSKSYGKHSIPTDHPPKPTGPRSTQPLNRPPPLPQTIPQHTNPLVPQLPTPSAHKI